MHFLHTRLTSSLEKGFVDQMPEQFSPLRRATMLKNQHYSFQLMYRLDSDNHAYRFSIEVESELKPYITLCTEIGRASCRERV